MTLEAPDHDRIIRLETQMGRFISDIESEKQTRVRVHSDLRKEFTEGQQGIRNDLNEIRDAQKRSDKILYAGVGVLAALQVAVQVYLR